MENNKTAVEWAEDTLANLNSAVINQEITTQEYHEQRVRLWEQAKTMEKAQILDACHHGVDYDKSPYKDAEEYYNKTYGKE